MTADAERKMQFLYALRSKGVTNSAVMTAMERIDRADFIRGVFAERAYEDSVRLVPPYATASPLTDHHEVFR